MFLCFTSNNNGDDDGESTELEIGKRSRGIVNQGSDKNKRRQE